MSVSISALSVRMQKDNNVFSYFACGTTWRRTAPCQQQQCEQLKALACWKRRFMAAYCTPPTQTHTHTDAHSRKQRRSDWRGAAEKNAAITQKVVCKISERSREQKPQLPGSPTIVVVVVAAALIVGSIVLASFERAVGLVKELAVANLSVECHYNDLLSSCAEKYAMIFIKSATTEQQQQQKRTHCEFSFWNASWMPPAARYVCQCCLISA